jgi:MFS family permease
MTIKQELKGNWVILALAICTLLSAFVPGLSFPFIFKSVIDEFGWTREQATLLATLFFAPGAVVAIIIGRIIDLTGIKRALIVVSICGGVGMVSFLWTTSLTSYYVPGMLMGISMAGTIVSIKTLIARCFDAGQGTAMGIAYMVAGFGTVGLPVLMASLIDALGWRGAMASMSVGVWFITLPLIIFGLNESKLIEPTHDHGTSTSDNSELLRAIAKLAKEPRFWLIVIAITTVAAVDQGLLQHTNLYLEVDLEFDMSTVAPAVSLMFLAGAIGRPLMGWTFDRLSTRGISLAYLLLAITCLLALPISGIAMLILFMIFRGITHAGVLLDSPVLGKHCYGKQDIGLIIGVFTAVISVGFALGPWIMGRMFEIYNSYTPAFILFAFLSLFAAGLLFLVEPTYWIAQREKQTGTPIEEAGLD